MEFAAASSAAPGTSTAHPILFREVSYCLASVYALLAFWCIWKLAVFSSVSWPWTGQKSLHAFAAVAAGVRAAFFFLIPTMPKVFFLIFVSEPYAPLWISILDGLPSIMTLGLISVLTLTWASSYYALKRNEQFYQRKVKRTFKWLFALLCVLQAVIWIIIGFVNGANDALAVVEGTLYALAFGWAAFLVFLYGKRTSSVALNVSVLGLSSRTLLRRKIMLQAVVCALAFTARAMLDLGAAIAAAVGVDDTFDETSIAGICVTAAVCVFLDIVPISVILLQNRRALGKAQIPGPAAILRPVVKFVSTPFVAVYARFSRNNAAGGRYSLHHHGGSFNGVGAASPPGVFIGRGFSSSLRREGLLDASSPLKGAEEGLIAAASGSGSGGSSNYGSAPMSTTTASEPVSTLASDEQRAYQAPVITTPDRKSRELVSEAAKRLSMVASPSASGGPALTLPTSLDMARSSSVAAAAGGAAVLTPSVSAPNSSSSLYKVRRNTDALLSAELQKQAAGGDAVLLTAPFSPGTSVDPTSLLMAAGGRTAAIARAAIASAASSSSDLAAMDNSSSNSSTHEKAALMMEGTSAEVEEEHEDESSSAEAAAVDAVASAVGASASPASKKKGSKKKSKR
jgi:Protein of unknown function (DUF1084)